MNRLEAHEILSDRLAQFCELVKVSKVSPPFSISEEHYGSVSGVRYSIEIGIESGAEGTLVVSGRIHDNNSARFSLLEEKLVVDGLTSPRMDLGKSKPKIN